MSGKSINASLVSQENVFFKLMNLGISFFREECSDKGGTNDGTCASGYGICCTCKS